MKTSTNLRKSALHLAVVSRRASPSGGALGVSPREFSSPFQGKKGDRGG